MSDRLPGGGAVGQPVRWACATMSASASSSASRADWSDASTTRAPSARQRATVGADGADGHRRQRWLVPAERVAARRRALGLALPGQPQGPCRGHVACPLARVGIGTRPARGQLARPLQVRATLIRLRPQEGRPRHRCPPGSSSSHSASPDMVERRGRRQQAAPGLRRIAQRARSRAMRGRRPAARSACRPPAQALPELLARGLRQQELAGRQQPRRLDRRRRPAGRPDRRRASTRSRRRTTPRGRAAAGPPGRRPRCRRAGSSRPDRRPRAPARSPGRRGLCSTRSCDIRWRGRRISSVRGHLARAPGSAGRAPGRMPPGRAPARPPRTRRPAWRPVTRSRHAPAPSAPRRATVRGSRVMTAAGSPSHAASSSAARSAISASRAIHSNRWPVARTRAAARYVLAPWGTPAYADVTQCRADHALAGQSRGQRLRATPVPARMPVRLRQVRDPVTGTAAERIGGPDRAPGAGRARRPRRRCAGRVPAGHAARCVARSSPAVPVRGQQLAPAGPGAHDALVRPAAASRACRGAAGRRLDRPSVQAAPRASRWRDRRPAVARRSSDSRRVRHPRAPMPRPRPRRHPGPGPGRACSSAANADRTWSMAEPPWPPMPTRSRGNFWVPISATMERRPLWVPALPSSRSRSRPSGRSKSSTTTSMSSIGT